MHLVGSPRWAHVDAPAAPLGSREAAAPPKRLPTLNKQLQMSPKNTCFSPRSQHGTTNAATLLQRLPTLKNLVREPEACPKLGYTCTSPRSQQDSCRRAASGLKRSSHRMMAP